MSFDLELGREKPFEKRAEMFKAIKGLTEEMSGLMDEICGEEERIRINRLELDLGNIRENDFEEIFLKELKGVLTEKVLKLRNDQAISATVKSQSTNPSFSKPQNQSEEFVAITTSREIEAIIYFLNNGYFPWWNPIQPQNNLNEILAATIRKERPDARDETTSLINALTKSKQARIRLVTNFEWELIEDLLKSRFPEDFVNAVENLDWFDKTFSVPHSLSSSKEKQLFLINSVLNKKQNMIQILTDYVQLVGQRNSLSAFIKEQLFQKFSHLPEEEMKAELQSWIHDITKEQKISISKSSELFKEILKLNAFQDNKDMPERKVLKKDVEESTGIEVGGVQLNHAGIVIAWPLLKTLFENRGLLNDKKFLNETAQLKALQLLNYLVAGDNGIEECQMPLNKILCGLLPSDNAFPLPELTVEDKEEVDKLLKHLITTWSVLKNTSPNGLREGFIARNGNLEEKEEHWLLKVEQKSIDIMMSSIPWGYNTVKLAWMPKMLIVEW